MPHPSIFDRKHPVALRMPAWETAFLARGKDRWDNAGDRIGPFLRINVPAKDEGRGHEARSGATRGIPACNLYRLASSVMEVADLFQAAAGEESGAGDRIYPGASGPVIAEGRMRSMTWGFPMIAGGTGRQRLEPINNAGANLLDSGFWRDSFERRRCLIPLNAFATADHREGRVTQRWISIAGRPIFACAGIWRDSDEWGPVYAMVMTDPGDRPEGFRDRMPVILSPADCDTWLNGSAQDARMLCRPFEEELTVRFTNEP